MINANYTQSYQPLNRLNSTPYQPNHSGSFHAMSQGGFGSGQGNNINNVMNLLSQLLGLINQNQGGGQGGGFGGGQGGGFGVKPIIPGNPGNSLNPGMTIPANPGNPSGYPGTTGNTSGYPGTLPPIETIPFPTTPPSPPFTPNGIPPSTFDNRVEGTFGDDVLNGTDAAETLNGFRGNDILTGGGGADVFDIGGSISDVGDQPVFFEGVNRITDFQPGQDKLDTTIAAFVPGGVFASTEVVYDPSNGNLFIGNPIEEGRLVLRAVLEPNLNLTQNDILSGTLRVGTP